MKRGRPPTGRAKSTDPDFMSTTVYVKGDLYADVRNILFRQRKDFSDLVGELLAEWLKKQK